MMKHTFKFLFIFFSILFLLTGCFSGSISTDENINLLETEVIRVIDGDTFVANINGVEEKVRLLLIDTPEVVHPSKPVEPFGPEASQFTKELIEGKKVYLEFDIQERDKYGRILAYVYLLDGRMLNELLLEKGLAQVVVYQPNVKYVDEFREIQKEAQKNKVGLWGDLQAED